MDRCRTNIRALSRYWALAAAGTLILNLFVGCHALRPDPSGGKEYSELRNSVESYEDEDGNWVRPEGRRADKSRGTTASAIGKYIPGLSEKPPEKEKATSLFREADQFFEQAKNASGEERKKLFRSAASKYISAGKYWTSSYLEANAMCMAGESYFFAEDYPKAEQQYAKLLKEYPRTRYQDLIDSRRMEIAMYWLKLDEDRKAPALTPNLTDKRRPWSDTGGHGRKTLENIRLGNPTGKLSDDVTMELANAAFKKGDYVTAADHYSDLRMTYPESPHQFDAHFLGLKSVMETYGGPDYNEGPLLESEKLIKQMFRQFPNESKEQKDYLNRAFAEVRYRKAERNWNSAEFRINRGENNAARIFLDRILTEYEDTPFADKARDALEKIKDEPGEPVQRFQWLANLFPENDPVKPFLHSSATK